jgi:hypothetical protein
MPSKGGRSCSGQDERSDDRFASGWLLPLWANPPEKALTMGPDHWLATTFMGPATQMNDQMTVDLVRSATWAALPPMPGRCRPPPRQQTTRPRTPRHRAPIARPWLPPERHHRPGRTDTPVRAPEPASGPWGSHVLRRRLTGRLAPPPPPRLISDPRVALLASNSQRGEGFDLRCDDLG